MQAPATLDLQALRAAQASGAQVVDLRAPVIYAREHAPETINVPFSRRGFGETAQQFLDGQRPVALIGDNPVIAEMACTSLKQIGYDVLGHLDGGFNTWKQAGQPTAAIPQITVDELAALRDSHQPPRVIDVRESWEFAGGHIEDAEPMPLSRFSEYFADLPRDEQLVFVCASGARSNDAVAFLYRLGHRNVANLAGGMNIWQASGRPVA